MPPRPSDGVLPALPTTEGPSPADQSIAEDPSTKAAPAVDRFDDELRLRSSRGGVLYLLNSALALGLYGDFTAPLRRRISLDPWDFVELMARRLGAAGGARRDPIWLLLAHLANRPSGVRPGQGFRSPRGWRIDHGWLEPFRGDRRPWRWWTPAGRLVVVHPAGFPILDVARRTAGTTTAADVRAQLARLTTDVPQLRRMTPPDARRSAASARDRWLDALAAYVRARLALALVPPPDRALARVVFAHDAEIVVRGSVVESTFRLDRLPIAIRIAGLDRDPGWVPAAGRSIRFRFA
jgi:hypothetical protein